MEEIKTYGQRILIVSANYGVIEKVSSTLGENGFGVQVAFSYRDAIQMLEQGGFDVVLVDAAMTDRLSGSPVVKLLESFQVVPVILLANNNGALPSYTQPPVQMVLGALDKRTITRGVFSVLNIPLNGGRSDRIEQVGRAGEIETLFALGKSLTEVLDLSEVLNRVVAAARYLTGAEEGMILLPDDEAGQLYLRAKVGIDDEVAQNFRIKTQDTYVGTVFQKGEPVLVGALGLQKVKTHHFVKALLYVPILLKGKPIGVLGVTNKVSDAVFNLNDQDLLLNLASYAAIAIENARIHEETLERKRELQTLVEASQVVNSSVALERTLPNICEQLVQVLNVNWSEIYTWDQENQRLHLLARYQCALWRPGHAPVFRLEHHPALRSALDENRYLRVTRSSTSIAGEAAHLERIGVHTMLVTPIWTENHPLGVVRSYYINPPDSAPHQEALHYVQHQGLEALVAVAEANGHTSTRHVVRLIDDINRTLNADWSELVALSHNGQALTMQAMVGAGVWLDRACPVMNLSRYPDLLHVVTEQVPLIECVGAGNSASKESHPLLDATRSLGVLALPLIQRGQTQGVVLFGDTRHTRSFSQREVDLGRAIVGQAATALENASLVHDLERSLRELRDAQERLIQTARLSAMGELAAAVAHQINNPLTTILADAELMLQDEVPGSPNYKSLQAIWRAGKRASGVARRLLATARPTEENAPVQPIDVVDTIEGILSLVRSHIEQDRIQILAALPDEKLPPVWAVQGQLDDIWLNLLLNAHDALIGSKNAQIGIEVYYQPYEAIEVVVWDNGPGIPPDIVDNIFKPFFTTKPVGEGTGLGLHICRQVIDRVGGDIWVESTLDKGTRFVVRLPVQQKGGE
jgi:signal transduction histidine kinase